MIRYEPFPIIINGSYLDEAFRDFVKRLDSIISPDLERWLFIQSNRLDYVRDGGQRARLYDHSVRMVLAGIRATGVGMTLLKCLPKNVPIWIIPCDSWNLELAGKNAITGQMSGDHTKGVLIRYSPEMWLYAADGRTYPGYRPDEVLFHEMVHAYRYAEFGFYGMNHDPLRDNDDHEEFLAAQLTNVYRSERKAQKFGHAYMTGKLGTKAEVEYTLLSYEPFLRAIEEFLNDPMVKAAAQIKTEFNPFRDIARLKQAREQDLRRGRIDTRSPTHGGLPPPVKY